MQRLDDPTSYNPFGWRLAQLKAGTVDDDRRRHLLDDLTAWEAVEIAHGIRHVTIVHGEPTTVAESRRLSAFYEQLAVIVNPYPSRRVRGTGDFVTVSVSGPGADTAIGAISDHAAADGWSAAATAVPAYPGAADAT